VPMVKPQAFAASYCADRLKHIMSHQKAAWLLFGFVV
jgi:hypothetical protein